MSTDAPALTVVLAALADAAVLETTLLHLHAQSARESIEVIVVAPSVERLGPLPVTMDEMHSCRVIEVPSATTGCEANAAGARAAAAPIVAFAEDHSYVAPRLGRGTPRGAPRRLGRGRARGREREPGHDDELGGLRDELWPLDGAGRGRAATVPPRPQLQLQARRAARHRRRAREPPRGRDACSTTGSPPPGTASTSSPVPASRTSTSRAGRSRSASSSTPGRVYASSLREGWSTPRKAIYALASPLIPLVRFGRSLRLIRRPGHRDIVPTAVIPALALGILCDGAGPGHGPHRRRGQLGEGALGLRVSSRRLRHRRRPTRHRGAHGEPESTDA